MEDQRFDAIDAIMEFSETHKLTLRFKLADLEELIRAEAYTTLIQMVEAEIQLEKPSNQQSLQSLTKALVKGQQEKAEKNNFKCQTLSLSEIVSLGLEM